MPIINFIDTFNITEKYNRFSSIDKKCNAGYFKTNKITIQLSEVESSRTHFEVLEASSPRKLPCPLLEDSTIFEPLKNARNLAENLQRPFFWFPQAETVVYSNEILLLE